MFTQITWFDKKEEKKQQQKKKQNKSVIRCKVLKYPIL